MFCASGAEFGHNSAQISARFCIWTGRSNFASNVFMIFIFVCCLWAVGGDAAARGLLIEQFSEIIKLNFVAVANAAVNMMLIGIANFTRQHYAGFCREYSRRCIVCVIWEHTDSFDTKITAPCVYTFIFYAFDVVLLIKRNYIANAKISEVECANVCFHFRVF